MNPLAVLAAIATINNAPVDFNQQPVITTIAVLKSAHTLGQINQQDLQNVTRDVVIDISNYQRGINPNPWWRTVR